MSASMRGADGGAGNDLLDGRLVSPFSGQSPRGYDAELSGGVGDDVLVANAGRMVMTGGTGSDTFVLTALSAGNGATPVELVIEAASTDDRLLVPYALFDGSGGGVAGSPLMPVLGGIGDLSLSSSGARPYFDWLLENDYWTSSDLTTGIIHFVGAIEYTLDGADLLIHLYKGEAQDIDYIDDLGAITTVTEVSVLRDTETIVRVTNFVTGELGIQFYDRGAPTIQTLPDGSTVFHYPNHDAIVHVLTNDGVMFDALEERPVAVAYTDSSHGNTDPAPTDGTAGDDIIVLAVGEQLVHAGAGNDVITTASSNDFIDGGDGNDTMQGGAGDDSYIVGSPGDVVIELATGANGVDAVIATIDYVLPTNVENLELLRDAVTGTGNVADNVVSGTEAANILYGLAGNDTLTGGGGADTLIGGSGNDDYVYTLGDGNVTISDQGMLTDADTLLFNVGVTTSDVSFVRPVGAAQDLMLVLSDGSRIRLAGYSASASASVETVKFADGTTWTKAQLDTYAATAPAEGNTPPAASDDFNLAVTTREVIIPTAALLANDSDVNADALSIVSVQDAVQCIVAITPEGDISFAAAIGYTGLASFTYTVADGHGGTSTAKVEIRVNAAAFGSSLTGTAGNDVLTGTAGADILDGQGGDDVLIGGADADQLIGGDGTDTASYANASAPVSALMATPEQNVGDAAGDSYSSIEKVVGSGFADYLEASTTTTIVDGGGGADVIFGSSAGDSLSGGLGQDNLIGLGGNDTLIGGADIDSVQGNDGDDLLDAATGDTVGTQDQLTGGAGNDTYIANTDDLIIETGGNGNDTVRARSAFALQTGISIEVLEADAAAVTRLTGNELSQRLVNNPGTGAELVGGGGDDRVDGGNAAEVLWGDFANGTGPGTAGKDTIYGGSGNDTLSGEAADDTLFGDGDNDALYGGTGADSLDGGAGDDTLSGDADNDTLAGGDSIDIMMGASGDDRLLGQAAADQLSGGAGTDTLIGGLGTDSLSGDDGDDYLDGITDEATAAKDTLAGGAGNDTYLVNGTDVVTEVASSGADTVLARSTYILSAGAEVEILQADSASVLTLTGNEFGQILQDSAGIVAQLRGGGGNDSLLGSASADTLYGDFAGGTGPGAAGADTLYGNAGGDTLYGEGGSDLLYGGAGVDLVYGGGGDDTLDGVTDEATSQTDTLVGGLGNDTFIVGGADVVTEAAAGGTDLVLARTTYTLTAGAEVEVLKADAVGVSTLIGNEFGQTLSNSTGVVAQLRGGGGNDIIQGSVSADTLWGDFAGGTGPGVAGNDTLYGDLGFDTINGEAGADVLYGGGGADSLYGGAGNDSLVGGAGLDSLSGDDGDDWLDGVSEEATAQADTMSGGIGNDTYIVSTGDVVSEAVAGGTDTVLARTTYTLAAGAEVEFLQADSASVVTLTGNDLGQTLSNSVGVVAQLRGGGGGDIIQGSVSADTLWGDFAGGTGAGVTGNDTMYGDLGNDTISGEGGADFLYGGGGLDSLDGGGGADELWGDAGNDTLKGGTGTDRFAFRAGFGRDLISDLEATEVIDVRGFGAAYGDLVFTVGAQGLEISSAKFGAGNVIVVSGATGPLAASQFLFA